MRRLSEAEKTEIWDRFEAGDSLRSISRRLSRPPSTIRTHVVAGGFRRPRPGPEVVAAKVVAYRAGGDLSGVSRG